MKIKNQTPQEWHLEHGEAVHLYASGQPVPVELWHHVTSVCPLDGPRAGLWGWRWIAAQAPAVTREDLVDAGLVRE